MPSFGSKSLDRLAKVHPDLQKVMFEAIKRKDFSIQYGYRSPEEQLELFKIGRELRDGQWVKVGPIVTTKDGTIKKSKHNYKMAKAVDILPYPFLANYWQDKSIWFEYAEVIKEAARVVDVKIIWGGDWDSLFDGPHFELA